MAEEPKATAVDVVEIREDGEEDFRNEPQQQGAGPCTDHVSKSEADTSTLSTQATLTTGTTTSQERGPDSEREAAKLETPRSGPEQTVLEGQRGKVVDTLPPVPEGEVRSEALHLHGVDDMSTEDVLQLFSLYGPRHVEWINDKSCNVVWEGEDEESARRALNGVGKQLLATIQEDNDQGDDKPSEGKEGSDEGVSWWLAEPHPKADQLLMRHATAGDVKLPGSARRSKYYKRYGNPNLTPTDLRGRLARKRSHSKGEPTEDGDKEEEEEMEVEPDPLSYLVKRPKPMHADRGEDGEEEEEERGEGGEIGARGGGGGGGGGGGEGGADLRGLLKKKRRRRDLQMRLGTCPRLVEEHR